MLKALTILSPSVLVHRCNDILKTHYFWMSRKQSGTWQSGLDSVFTPVLNSKRLSYLTRYQETSQNEKGNDQAEGNLPYAWRVERFGTR